MTSITDIEGIGLVNAKKLKRIGVRSTGALLKYGKTTKRLKELASATGISADRILKWVNRADLMRIRGIGPKYAELLEEAGVNTVTELAKRDPKVLLKKINNQRVSLSEKLLRSWVTQAHGLAGDATTDAPGPGR
jgi:predicted flap endonuclease-1-like 5' DNA nuclease